MDDGRDGVALRGDGAGEAVGVTSDDGGGGASVVRSDETGGEGVGAIDDCESPEERKSFWR